MTDRKRPIDQAIDIAVYAPLGFVLEARKLLPSFVERGRAQVQMTRMIGKFAVKQGQNEAEKRLIKAQRSADAVMGELGLRPADDPAPIVAAPAVPEPGSDPISEATTPTSQSGEGAKDLAIPDYD
ncbi:MAG: hypothetical protein KDB35_15300, partial [Acidimicrobiales bacterium]|nr:hypothetical protein [Acidimicrobiales bacterium]